MTKMSRERREKLELEVEGISYVSVADSSLMAYELRALLRDSAWRERVERQASGLVEHWGETARQLEISNGVTQCDRRVADSMRALSKELRAIVNTGDEE